MSPIASLRLTPGADFIVQAHAWLDRAASDEQWPARTAFALQLSMEEALTNILMYGFRDAEAVSPCVVLTLFSSVTCITLEITDNGLEFDPTRTTSQAPAPSLSSAPPGGHGLRFMRHYLHDLQYSFVNGCNRLRLIARLDGPGDSS